MLAQQCGRGNPFFKLRCLTAIAAAASASLWAADPAFLGKDSCASSGCHGGGGAHQNQSIVWARQDPHSRAPATLGTARSKRLAELLNIPDPKLDARCTSCHEPWQNLAGLPPHTTAVSEAVSCETCHGPASDYLRSHTRKDLDRPQKGLDGLKDLTVLYNRANSCVACHQALDAKLLEAGHPELLFELDGQTASMPRHWREKPENSHAAIWLTGQATALRELTAQVLQEAQSGTPSARVVNQWQAALWIVQTALPNGPISHFDTNAANSTQRLKDLHRAADQAALEAPALARTLRLTVVENLCSSEAEFAKAPGPASQQAPRAERLVLALDRLLYDRPKRPVAVQERTDELFRLVQSRPDFAPDRFAASLAAFRKTMTPAQ